ncbi:OmpA family protein [Arsenicibacter rosenii]|uniref:Flagellar motor protein MotB n=1 Tax=Arsenicibacter rosenii TaxID=1750698 RepID=A0A1S2VD38_9BACT|nr:OmpA family protein [Arsenicibacter rosenii]OIN56599.1 flagellar motor protein MotB [Arsenicibacter rosenii]
MKTLLSLLLICLGTVAFGQKMIKKVSDPTTVTIKAVDEKTQKELEAQYAVQAVLGKKTFQGVSKPGNSFSLILTKTDTLVVTTRVKGYYETEETLLIACDTCGLYEHIALMEKQDSVFSDLQVNKAIRLDNVYFDQSSYILRPESYTQLNKLLKTLQGNPKLVIEIAGHTDNVGDRQLNKLLSQNRAKVIANYLANSGIRDERLQYKGYGDTKPVAPNDSEENKRLNRRVEFVVLKL